MALSTSSTSMQIRLESMVPFIGEMETGRQCPKRAGVQSCKATSMNSLVFLPGAGGTKSFWEPVASRLGDLGVAHCLSWPGFGEVPADASIGSLDDLFHWLVRRLPEGRS